VNFDPQHHSLKCPKCHHGMTEITHGEIAIDRCSNCHGLWFDADEAHQLKQLPGSHVVDDGHAETGVVWDSHAEIDCPHCGKRMEQSSDAKQKHIWYEICPEHGMFMDAGEFRDFREETLLDWFKGVIKGDRDTVCP